MTEFDWAALIGGALQAIAIAAGLRFAGRQVKLSADQNRASERWRRTEFAASLMEQLSKDDELAMCARALDWGVGPLIIPEKYKLLYSVLEANRRAQIATSTTITRTDIQATRQPVHSDSNSDYHFSHDWSNFARAVRPGLDVFWNDPKLLIYRYCFDSFGTFLETIQRHIDLHNVEPEDIIGLRYYLDLLAEAPYYDKLPRDYRLPNVHAKDVFGAFLKQYYPDGWYLVENRSTLPASRSFNRA